MNTGHPSASSTKPRLREEFPEGFDELEPNNRLHDLKESDALSYVSGALRDEQDYDAGNAILFLSQTGLLSHSGLVKIADMMLGDYSLFLSKAGAFVYPKICRSIGMWMLKHDEGAKGAELLKRGFLRSLWRASPGGRLKGWADCRYRDQFPEDIERNIRSVEDGRKK